MNKVLITISMSISSFFLWGQSDTLVLENGVILIGTLNNLGQDIVSIETDFAENEIQIEWSQVKYFSTSNSFIVEEDDGHRYFGRLKSISSDSVELITYQSHVLHLGKNEIISLEQVNSGFKNRFSFNVDLGFNMAQSNDLRQLTSGGSIGYKATKWELLGRFNGLSSTQQDAEDIRRWDRSVAFNYFLVYNWFVNADVSFFSSTEQSINLRMVPKVGVGKRLVRTEHIFWKFNTGFNMNFEDYSNQDVNRQSVEAFLGTKVEFSELNDISLSGEVVTYPSFTEQGRVRLDADLSAKIDLPLGVYFITKFNYNFDNQPFFDANGTDYVFSVGLGWEW